MQTAESLVPSSLRILTLDMFLQRDEIQQKIFPLLDKIFHVFLIRRLQKYARNSKTGQKILSDWLHQLSWYVYCGQLKRPQSIFNFLNICPIPLPSRTFSNVAKTFVVFNYSRNILYTSQTDLHLSIKAYEQFRLLFYSFTFVQDPKYFARFCILPCIKWSQNIFFAKLTDHF